MISIKLARLNEFLNSKVLGLTIDDWIESILEKLLYNKNL